MKPRLLHPAYFAWIAIFAAGVGIYQVYGLPHVIWSYAYQGGGSGFASRVYTRCAFLGPYGEFIVPAQNGRCGWIVFFQEKEAGQ